MRRFGVLLAHRLRRDRLQLVLWIVGTAGLALLATVAVSQNFGDQAEREQIMRLTILAPAILVFRGTPNGAGEGEFAVFLILAFLALLAGLMSTFLAVRHTRAEEERGRAELIGSTPAGRTVPTVSTVAHGLLANVLLAVAVGAAFALSGLEVAGSFVAGAAVGAAGVVFFGIGLIAAQVFRTPRGANGFSVAVVLLAYLLRGIGDATGEVSDDGLVRTAAWPSWLSPIGWAQRTEPYVANDLAPILWSLGIGAVLIAVVFWFQSVRDSGDSILPAASGRADAGPALSGSLGLVWRLTGGSIAAWAAGAAVAGALATTLSPLVDEFGSDAPAIADALQRMVGPDASLDEAFITTFFTVVGILAAAAGLQAVMRARQEEAHNTAEPVLATPVPRPRWLADYGLVGVIAVAVVLGVSALAAVIGAQSTDDPGDVAAHALQAAVAQVPAVLIFVGLGMLLFVFVPRFAIAGSWTLLALGAFFGILGDMLGLPEWLHDLSPFAHSPVPIGDEVDWTGGTWMLVIAVAAGAVAVFTMREREIAGEG